MNTVQELFTEETLKTLFPAERANEFFDALFGDAEDGSYDIRLVFQGQSENALTFGLELHERPGKCLACNLTYGLPEVFSRHPVINIKGLVAAIDGLLDSRATCGAWKLGTTQTVSRKLHIIPLIIQLH